MSRWRDVRAACLAVVLLTVSCSTTPPPVERLSSNAPSARTDASSAYDPATKTIVLFGGADRSGVLGDTWTWDSGGWHQQHPATSPPPREFSWMGFDPATSRVVLFGGIACGPPHGNLPTGCEYQEATTSLHDTWTWEGSTWSRFETAHAPAPTDFRGDNGGIAGDAAHHNLLLVTWPTGGPTSRVETWTLSGGDWVQLQPAHPVADYEFSGPTYDAVSGHVLLQQLGVHSGVTYWWDGTDWRVYDLSVRTPHAYGTLVSAGRHGLLLFEGGNVWTWNGQTWSDVRTLPMTVSIDVHSRQGWTASYFEPHNELILFGGRVGPGGPVLLGDTVAWDGSAWTTLVPAHSSPVGPLPPCSASEAVSGTGYRMLNGSTGAALDIEFYLPASGPCHLAGSVTLTLAAGQSPLPIPNNPATQAINADLTAKDGGLVVTFTAAGICAFGQSLTERYQVGDFDHTLPLVLGSQCPSGSTSAPPITVSVRRTAGRP